MWIHLLISLFSANAESTLTIQNFESRKNTALIAQPKASESVKVGSEYFVETPIGKCYVTVSEVSGDFFRINTEQCGSEHIVNGKPLYPKQNVVIEKQIVSEVLQPAPTPAESITSPLEFIEDDFYREYLYNRLSFSASYLTGRSLSGTAALGNQASISDFNTSNTIAIGADYRLMNLPNNFSWTTGFNYNLPRSLGTYTLTTANGSVDQRLPSDPSFQAVSFYTNIRYEIQKDLYAHLGMNRLFADLSGGSGALSGDFGFHAGARYYPMEQFFVDGQINFYNLDYEVNNQEFDFRLTELEVKAGYTF